MNFVKSSFGLESITAHRIQERICLENFFCDSFLFKYTVLFQSVVIMSWFVFRMLGSLRIPFLIQDEVEYLGLF